MIFSLTAATFPKPTEVNEVKAKNRAVTYFDFKSGPLNVSLTTRIVLLVSSYKYN